MCFFKGNVKAVRLSDISQTLIPCFYIMAYAVKTSNCKSVMINESGPDIALLLTSKFAHNAVKRTCITYLWCQLRLIIIILIALYDNTSVLTNLNEHSSWNKCILIDKCEYSQYKTKRLSEWLQNITYYMYEVNNNK